MARLITLAALAALLIAPLAFAEEDSSGKEPEVKEATAKEVKHELQVFERDFDTVDIDFKLQAVDRLAKCVHEDIARELLKMLYREPDVHVRAAVARGLRNQKTSATMIGRKTVRLLEDESTDPLILEPLLVSLGLLDYRKAWEPVTELIWHDEDKVTIAAFWVLGRWKEVRAHRDIQNFWDMYPEEGKFKTGSVTVDTGASGDADQRAAKAKWKAKYGSAAKRRPRPDCVKALKAAVNDITGESLKNPGEFRQWVKDHKREIKAAERRRD